MGERAASVDVPMASVDGREETGRDEEEEGREGLDVDGQEEAIRSQRWCLC
jgi:hypothetical protein